MLLVIFQSFIHEFIGNLTNKKEPETFKEMYIHTERV